MVKQLFLRLNRNYSLTGAEIRNAQTGPVVEAISLLCSHGFLQNCISFSTRKGEDSNLAAKILYLEVKGTFLDTKKTNLDRFVEEYKKNETPIFKSYTFIASVFDVMESVFSTKDKLLRNQGDIPVYYWLFREHTSEANNLYYFLSEFEARRVQGDRGYDITDFSAYNFNRRNTNDAKSLSVRFDILNSCFLNNVIPLQNRLTMR
jgi:hypothetical protein